MEISIKWKWCRVCLEDETGMESIFQKDDDNTELYKKISICGGIQIDTSENLPDKICMKCVRILNYAYEFRKMCQNSDEYLKSILVDTSMSLKKRINERKEKQGEVTEVSDASNDLFSMSHVDDDESSNVEYLEEDDSPPNESTEQFKLIEHEQGNEDDSENSHVYTINIKTEDIILDDEHLESFDVRQSEEMELETVDEDDEALKPICKNKKPTSPNVDQWPYVCEICGNHYQRKGLLTLHMKMHQKTRSHECEICKKTFRTACNLQAHVRIHTGEKPFECQYCPRRFTNRSTHLKHERVHTNERPFKCQYCDKRFTYSYSLSAHEKIHTGEKTYLCEVCNKKFTLPHQLKAHLATKAHKIRETASLVSKAEVISAKTR